MMGIKPVTALETLAGWGVTVVGANCGNGPAEIERVMTEMSQARPEGVVLMAKSNAGMPRWKDDRITYGGTPEVMADYARRMKALGVRIIGGCCGSTPEHIAAMRAALPWREVDGRQRDCEGDHRDQRMHDDDAVRQPLLVHVLDGEVKPAKCGDAEEPECPGSGTAQARLTGGQQKHDYARNRKQSVGRGDDTARRRRPRKCSTAMYRPTTAPSAISSTAR